MKFKAILFDFDGVLGRTMEDNYRAWKHVFSGYGVQLEKQAYFLTEGLNSMDVSAHFLPPAKRTRENIEAIASAKESYYLQHNTFSLYEDAETVVKKLAEEGFMLGIVSGAGSNRLKKTLDRNFMNFFDTVITSERYEKGKPSAEPYQRAAYDLKVPPSDCMVVENAVMGIESAHAAGMYCVALTTTVDRKHLEQAEKVIEKLTEIYPILGIGAESDKSCF